MAPFIHINAQNNMHTNADVTIEILTTENTQAAVAIVCYSLTNQIKYIIK